MQGHVKADGMSARALYIGVDVHEKESQVAVYEKGGELLQEKSIQSMMPY